jgi:hypothetical protein
MLITRSDDEDKAFTRYRNGGLRTILVSDGDRCPVEPGPFVVQAGPTGRAVKFRAIRIGTG